MKVTNDKVTTYSSKKGAGDWKKVLGPDVFQIPEEVLAMKFFPKLQSFTNIDLFAKCEGFCKFDLNLSLIDMDFEILKKINYF